MLATFPGLDIDIMMVPVEGLFDLAELCDLGVHQLSINLEIFDDVEAARVMRQKHQLSTRYLLAFIESASSLLGPERVRSMLMVGLEPAESTLRGVQAILDHGGTPVLSPFRPDPSTPMREVRAPDATFLTDVFTAAEALAAKAGVALGPDCAPCTHNTLTFSPANDTPRRSYRPFLV